MKNLNQDYQFNGLRYNLNTRGCPRTISITSDDLETTLAEDYFEGDNETLDLVDAFTQINKRKR